MSLPLFPDNTRDSIQEIIDMIGRTVTFYDEVTVSGCGACSLDPIANTSTDSFCPVCYGTYWIPIYSGLPLTAHITYGQVDDKSWQTGGILDNGTITAKVMYSGWIADWINEAEYVVIDDREFDVVNVDIRGVPSVNRIIVRLKEKER
jgi:hypothetical protein